MVQYLDKKIVQIYEYKCQIKTEHMKDDILYSNAIQAQSGSIHIRSLLYNMTLLVNLNHINDGYMYCRRFIVINSA